jgi:hypothetical protein
LNRITACVGITIAPIITSRGNSTSAKVPGNNFPSLFSAIARTCNVLVETSTEGSMA